MGPIKGSLVCTYGLRSARSIHSAPEHILGAWNHHFHCIFLDMNVFLAAPALQITGTELNSWRVESRILVFLFTKQFSDRFDTTVWTLCTHWPQPMTTQPRHYITLRHNCQTRLLPSKGQFTQLVPWLLEVFYTVSKKGLKHWVLKQQSNSYDLHHLGLLRPWPLPLLPSQLQCRPSASIC